MSDSKTPQELLTELLAALSKSRGKPMEAAAFASQNNLRKQFVCDIRDGEYKITTREGVRVFAKQDVRYQKIEELCTQRGISGFLEAVEAAQRADPRNAPPTPVISFGLLEHPMNLFERALEMSKALQDPQIEELYYKLWQRLRELRQNQTKPG